MATYNPGFVGYAYVNGTYIRCSDFNMNVKQEPLFYDHIIGLRDTIPPDIYTIKGDGGDRGTGVLYNRQKFLWRPSVKICQGGFTFPWTNNNNSILFEEARGGKSFPFTFRYACGMARKFTNCKVNSYTLKMSNGDIVTASLDIIATHEETETDSTTGMPISTTEKIVTWDAVKVSINGIEKSLVNIEFTINNGVMPIYTAGRNASDTNPLEAKELRVGMQQFTGTLSFYDENFLNFLDYVGTPTRIAIEINYTTTAGPVRQYVVLNLTVLFKPMEQSAALGPIIRTVPFVGVDYYLDPTPTYA